jgi:hypothetical protein
VHSREHDGFSLQLFGGHCCSLLRFGAIATALVSAKTKHVDINPAKQTFQNTANSMM